MGPCIVNIYPTRCNVTQFIDIWKLLYMFRVEPPPIIRSTFNCIYSIWYLSHRYCYLPLSWRNWTSSTHHQEHIELYLQHLVSVTPLLLPAAIVEELELLHPSSGAHSTVSTVSGICHTVTPICRCRGRIGAIPRYRHVAVTVWQIPDVVDRVECAPDDGWRYHPKHVEQFTDTNKLCKVAFCWIYIGT